jgi:hypothetical protein
MDWRGGRIARVFGLTILLVLPACGDPNTYDARGYTKAPLEKPGVLIKGEGSSAMDSLGSPLVPRDTVIPPESTPPSAPPAKQ